MIPVRKAPPAKKRRQTRAWIVIVSVALIVGTVLASMHFWSTANNNASINNQANPPNADPAFAAFTNHYLDVMKSLNSSQTKAKMLTLLDTADNQTELFSWEGSKLTFASNPTGFYEDPFQILDSPESICVQWSIVYVSACLALGYQSRLVVAVDTQGWSYIHVWAEDYYHGAWVHVDPSDKVWNSPHRYLSWDWGPYIGSTVKVYAFEDNRYQDVTSTYSAHPR
jgi:transglutaminase-like putative cysteine protease